MKKQNVNNKLAFNKAAVAELDFNQLQVINGGGSLDFIGDVASYFYEAGQAVGHYISKQIN